MTEPLTADLTASRMRAQLWLGVLVGLIIGASLNEVGHLVAGLLK